MENGMNEKVPMIALIGAAVLGIIALALPWVSLFGDGLFTATGIDYLTHTSEIKELLKNEFETEIGYQLYVPLIILILAIVAAIVAALPVFGIQMDSKIVNGIILAVGIIMIILMLAYMTTTLYVVDEMEKVKPVYTLASCASAGCYISFAIAAITTILGACGLMGAFGKE